jgi:hypothetical protein
MQYRLSIQPCCSELSKVDETHLIGRHGSPSNVGLDTPVSIHRSI